ncbi:MAG: hypothetical protein U9R48_11180 [Chloroflexota bacterium]|nr:hypothetical protein [Chloroflexota bacterium]
MQIDTGNRQYVKAFLRFPFVLYEDVPQWVPPFARQARLVLDREHHPFYEHSEAAFFLAREQEETIGRLAVLENRRYNLANDDAAAFFALFECRDTVDASRALFEAGFDWARRRGLRRIKGPRGFSHLDGIGLLISGFAHRPAMGIPYALPYYQDLVEDVGFRKVDDILSGHMTRDGRVPEKIHSISEQAQKRRGLQVVSFRSRRDLLALAPRFRTLFNNSLGANEDNIPLTEKEVGMLARRLLAFADPRLIKVVAKGEELVGFLLAYPDVSAALQRCKGRLLSLSWWHLWREKRRTKWININGMGIVEKYRGGGGTAILFSELAKSVADGGFEHAELVQIRGDNAKMQRELQKLGVDFYKVHRLYEREL